MKVRYLKSRPGRPLGHVEDLYDDLAIQWVAEGWCEPIEDKPSPGRKGLDRPPKDKAVRRAARKK